MKEDGSTESSRSQRQRQERSYLQVSRLLELLDQIRDNPILFQHRLVHHFVSPAVLDLFSRFMFSLSNEKSDMRENLRRDSTDNQLTNGMISPYKNHPPMKNQISESCLPAHGLADKTPKAPVMN